MGASNSFGFTVDCQDPPASLHQLSRLVPCTTTQVNGLVNTWSIVDKAHCSGEKRGWTSLLARLVKRIPISHWSLFYYFATTGIKASIRRNR